MAKEIKSSAATETKMVESKYSTSSTNLNVAKSSAYELPSYQSSVESVSGLASSGANTSSYMQPTGNTYKTGGTNAFQSGSSAYKQLSSSGLQGLTTSQTVRDTTVTATTTAATTGTTKTTGVTDYTYGASKTKESDYSDSIFKTYASGGSMNYGSTGLSGALTANPVPTYGTTGLSSQYGASTTNVTTGTTGLSSQYGTSVTNTTTGTTGLSSQYGASVTNTTTGPTNSSSSSFAASFSGGSSGLKASGSNFTGGSNYTFQTKKY
jgi:hypothetical protein